MDVYLKVLGIMQDAGLPHVGCTCRRCRAATGGAPRHLAAGVAVVDRRRRPAGVWLLDATPDIAYQLSLLADELGPHPTRPHRLRRPDGIYLTHAHMGHVGGLPQLGPEGMDVHQLPLYGSAPLLSALWRMPLWTPLLPGLRLETIRGTQPHRPVPDLTVTPVPVPHRDEIGTGTFAFLVDGPRRTLLYLPDIDAWTQWPEGPAVMERADVALVDGSFYSRDELAGRPPVAHPLVTETLSFWKGWPGELWLTHLNHTNPVLDPESPERAAVEEAGARVANEGDVISL